MSYDPRRGSSPYLGMDVDEVPSIGNAASEGRATVRGERPVTAHRMQEGQSTSRRPDGIPKTVRRASGMPQRGVAPSATAASSSQVLRRPQDFAVSPAYATPQAAPFRPATAPRSRAAGPFALLGSLALRLLAVVLRLMATVLSAGVVCSALLTSSHRARLIEVLNLAQLFVPVGFAGHFVVKTPFGGALRGDLAIASIILFCADWICLVLSTSLRDGRERGA